MRNIILLLILFSLNSFSANPERTIQLQGIQNDRALSSLVQVYYQTFTFNQAKDYMSGQCYKGWYQIEEINTGVIEKNTMHKVGAFHNGQFINIDFRCHWNGPDTTQKILDKITRN